MYLRLLFGCLILAPAQNVPDVQHVFSFLRITTSQSSLVIQKASVNDLRARILLLDGGNHHMGMVAHGAPELPIMQAWEKNDLEWALGFVR